MSANTQLSASAVTSLDGLVEEFNADHLRLYYVFGISLDNPSTVEGNTEQILSDPVQESSPYTTKSEIVNEILSNYRGELGVPSPAELLILSDFEKQCTQEIEDLEAKNNSRINAITDLLRDLVENRRELKTKRHQVEICRSFRAPIHRLPPEILSRIFQFSLPDRRKTSRTHSPQLLLRVCKAWKLVAESEPALWNVLTYRTPFPPESLNFEEISQIWETYSSRAASIPLTIEVLGDNGHVMPVNFECTQKISSYFPRCISLSIVIASAWHLLYMAMRDIFALSNMESLSIRLNNELDLGPVEFDVFAYAAKLTKLKLNATPLHAIKIRFPFHQLTEFSYAAQLPLNSGGGEESIEALRWLMTKLVKIRTLDVYLHGTGHKSSDICETALQSATQEHSDVTSLDTLKSLSFRVAFRTSFNYVFRHFHFPALRSLRMVATARPARLLEPLPANFYQEPIAKLPFFAHLTSLSLIRIEINAGDLLALLRFTPLLSSLDVMLGVLGYVNCFLVYDEELLEGLTVNDPQGDLEQPIVPHLQDLRLYYTNDDEDFAVSSLYAKLALSRFNWANNRPGGRDLAAQRREAGLAYYPFRLYLKFEAASWPLHERVADEIGPLHSKIFHPEKSSSFLKEVSSLA